MYQLKLSYEHISLCELPELFIVGRGDQVIRHSVHLQKPWHVSKIFGLNIFMFIKLLQLNLIVKQGDASAGTSLITALFK